MPLSKVSKTFLKDPETHIVNHIGIYKDPEHENTIRIRSRLKKALVRLDCDILITAEILDWCRPVTTSPKCLCRRCF